MKVYHPGSEAEFFARDKLLQKSLRPEPLPFNITSEYPLVLCPQGSHTSFCLEDQGQLVAHANTWLRILQGQQKQFPVLLIGNVATAAEHRGKGYMRHLFATLDQYVKDTGSDAAILWSDLISFYQKFGFQPHGKEQRFRFQTGSLSRYKDKIKLNALDFSSVNKNKLLSFLALRDQGVPTLKRSSEEFSRLLTIPWTYLFHWQSSQFGDGYVILGKGYDMGGVIHEWGCESVTGLIHALAEVLEISGQQELLLLTPGYLNQHWQKNLNRAAYGVEQHHLALMKAPCKEVLQELDRAFIWGLDSI